MTSAVAIGDACEGLLRELIIAGYEGKALLDAFSRLRRIVIGAVTVATAELSPVSIKPANVRIAEPAKAVTRQPVPITAPPANAKAKARKALAQSGLAPSVVAVGSRLIEHFNIETGRCDPGLGDLAAATGFAERSVRRAVATLVSAGMFGVALHGGRAHTNAYQPNWPMLERLAANGDIKSNRPILSADPANSVRQNHRIKPDSDSESREALRAKRKPPRRPDPRQREMIMPMPGGLSQPEAAREAAHRRLWDDINRHFGGGRDKQSFVDAVSRITETIVDVGIAAELQRPGKGLSAVVAALDEHGLGKRAI